MGCYDKLEHYLKALTDPYLPYWEFPFFMENVQLFRELEMVCLSL